MVRGRSPLTSERLIDHLLDGQRPEPLADELAGWLVESPRFRRFADAHRDKIRKKLRGATDPDARLDVRTELRVAHRLLADRRIDVAFEPYGSTKGGPDFAVVYRAAPAFNLEVTRLRGRAGTGSTTGGPMLTKLRQLPPGAANVLLVAVDVNPAASFDPAAVARSLRSRADAKDEAFFVHRGFGGTRDFYDRFLRLGAVIVWHEDSGSTPRADAWTNGSARIGVPEPALRSVRGVLDGSFGHARR